jgi:hypothetical protein
MRLSVCAVALAIVMASDAACRSAAPFDVPNQATRAPDPSGCYVRVFDTPDYRGANEYINGPARLNRLGSLAGGQSWQKRIRSARVGPAATVTVWTGEQYGGQRWMMAEGSYATLPAAFDKSISSMEIRCAATSTPVAANNQPEPDRW